MFSYLRNFKDKNIKLKYKHSFINNGIFNSQTIIQTPVLKELYQNCIGIQCNKMLIKFVLIVYVNYKTIKDDKKEEIAFYCT